MPFDFTLANINSWVAIIFGALIITNPKLLSTLVGIYLIIVGLMGLMGLGIVRF